MKLEKEFNDKIRQFLTLPKFLLPYHQSDSLDCESVLAVKNYLAPKREVRSVFYRPKQILNSDIIIRGTCFHFFV